MPRSQKRVVANKFPLRLMPSIRKVAERLSQEEGVSLNQFINVAVAERVAYLQHEDWVARRAHPTQALVSKALQLLNRPSTGRPEPGDELPRGYRSVSRKGHSDGNRSKVHSTP
jgi:hypothetical protein